MFSKVWMLLLALLVVNCGDQVGPLDPNGDDALEGVLEEGPPLTDDWNEGKADEFGGDIPAYRALPDGAELDLRFEALFAPDDPTATLEIELIESVRTARLADERYYREGENPYRIRYAVYNLRNPNITEHLVAAANDGVDVQILLEADQLDPERTWNTMDEYLIENGFEFAPDHRDLSEEQRMTADLIGIEGSGLMHLKARIFETTTSAVVLSGSQNPGDHAVLNEETLHLINDPYVVSRYQAAYQAVLTRSGLVNTWNEDSPVNVLFTPAADGPRAVSHILEWVAEEDEQILLMVFSLRDLTAPGMSESLVDLLVEKAQQGVPVYVITDRKQSDGVDSSGNVMMSNDNTEDRLRSGGVHVYEAINSRTPYTAMHHKVAILGRTQIRVITDAANWTFSGLGSSSRRARNIESVLFVDSLALDANQTGRRYVAQWLRVLERYADQSSGEGEPAYAEVLADLTTASNWPTQPVRFACEQCETEWGEEIRVVGNHVLLGNWGIDGTGVSLLTDAESYPMWTTPTAVDLPLGLVFEWKLIAGFTETDSLRWEGGANRVDQAVEGLLSSQAGQVFWGTWRN